jgi:pimeloyl-ACP methyl ester carboxylesterase
MATKKNGNAPHGAPESATAEGLRTVSLSTVRGPVPALMGGPENARETPVFYLHGEGGLSPEDPFLLELVRERRVVAPFLPGFADIPAWPDAEARDMLDFTLFGLETFNGSGLNQPILMGHSMGGMIAAEMAALAPEKFARLTLISAMGLWLDDHPVADLFSTLPPDLPALLFHDQDAAMRAMAHVGVIGGGWDPSRNDPDLFVAHVVRQARQMANAGKLLFPIPDRGLRNRLYRISMPVSVIWGAQDRVAPPAYGEAFAAAIPHARLTIVPEAGHMPHWERPELVKEAAAFG